MATRTTHPRNGAHPSRAARGRASAMRGLLPARVDHGLGRLTARAREELTGRRLGGRVGRAVATCPACGRAVHGDDDHLRDRGDTYHAGCALYRHRTGERR
jgi:hypothetical protein